jgi:hypothetical protein
VVSRSVHLLAPFDDEPSQNGCIRSQKWKVQLPGGRWVYCRRSCAETLRVETVDFFETNAAGSGQLTNECGVFGALISNTRDN